MAVRIERLSTEVVNRIAAGEVIHRPANALKELLENSLDAGATQISVSVSQGGLKMLQIQDNGKGIHRGDLEIVCERFTTSKLRTFDDLRQIASFGFRGEALASVSHVAHVTITSKTADEPCAYKAHYRDGKLVAKKPGGSNDPVPCAGKNGTQILVEDLFYNLTTRRQAFKNTSEQYQRIVEVVQRYAVHFGGRQVGFVCKKHREPSCDVNTLATNSQLDVIKQIFGSKLASELLEFNCAQAPAPPYRDLEFAVHAWVSNANYNLKSSQFILFINERLVECASLRRACEYVYSLYLPKHTHPFVYMSLQMPAQNVDVNVHPTKREVQFLYEEVIVEAVSRELEKKLKGSNESRAFVVQPITTMMVERDPKTKSNRNSLPLRTVPTSSSSTRIVVVENDEESDEDDEEDAEKEKGNDKQDEVPPAAFQSIEVNLGQRTTPESKKYHTDKAPQKLVRTDHRSNTIDKYFFLESQRSSQTIISQAEDATDNAAQVHADDSPSNPSGAPAPKPPRSSKKRRLSDSFNDEATIENELESEDDTSSSRRENLVAATQDAQQLTSVQNLRQRIARRCSRALEKLFRGHTFVGVVNRQHCLIQYRTKLYLVRHRDVAFHLFYEKALQQFGAFRAFQLPVPLSVYELVYEALGNPRSGYDPEDGPRDQLADEIKQLLVTNGPMLAEYFAIDIDARGMLRSLPRLLGDHEPSLHSLPEFISQLAAEVQWDEEQSCFENVAHVLAQWYSELWYPSHPERSALVLEHVIFPALKNTAEASTSSGGAGGGGASSGSSGSMLQPFSPPDELNDNTILRPVACLTKLYRIFERC